MTLNSYQIRIFVNLQSDLDQLYIWAKNNNMTFNGDKFESIKHGENMNLKNSYQYISSESDEIEDV